MPATAETILELQFEGVERVGRETWVYSEKTVIDGSGDTKHVHAKTLVAGADQENVYVPVSSHTAPMIDFLRQHQFHVDPPKPSGMIPVDEWVLPRREIPGLQQEIHTAGLQK